MLAVDLFAGAGGLATGLKMAGFSVVLANEVDNNFAKTYELNHPTTKVLVEDIHQINFAGEIAALGLCDQIDLVFGGPPCQGFSTVGKKEQNDPRNSLLMQFLRAIDEINPKMVLFENVSGFKNLYGGTVYQQVISSLESRGYLLTSGILEAANYGLPQFRQRMIILGSREQKLSFPKPTHGPKGNLYKLPTYLPLMDAISDLSPLEAGGSTVRYLSAPENAYQARLRGKLEQATEHNCAQYGIKMQEILSLIPTGGSVDDLPDRLKPKGYFNNTYARLLPDQPSPTITRNFGTPSSSRCVHPFQNRALSTREGARLQGFSDDYVFYGSKTSKNLQIGNAVPPVLGLVLGNAMIEDLAAGTVAEFSSTA